MVELISVNSENIGNYVVFEKCYDRQLKEYMSRIYPNHHEDFEEMEATGLLLWSYIFYNKNPIGSIWIEKESKEKKTAVLGVFLADESARGKHLGEEAIGIACRKGAQTLSVDSVELNVRLHNERAIKCYEKCGFKEEYCFTKPNGIEVIHMLKMLS